MDRKSLLTNKQHAFINKYLSNGFNAHDAALSAGYSKSVADTRVTVITENPKVKSIIEKAQAQIIAQQDHTLLVTYERKVLKLMRVLDEVIPDDKGEPILYTKLAEGIKALQELNKMQGHIAPDRKINMTVKLTKERLKDASIAYDEF